MRRRVVEGLRDLDAVAVENSAYPGTPDVNYVEGWIELKWLRAWPRQAETPVRVDHFRPEQKVWMRRRWRRGGAVFLLLQVRREWLLFDGPTAAKVVGTAARSELTRAALRHWREGVDWGELKLWLDRSSCDATKRS